MKPSTIVRSLAIGDPADGPSALAAIRRTGGRCEDPTDPEVLDGIRLLAETEGLFAETAGGTVVAAARRLAEGGAFADGGAWCCSSPATASRPSSRSPAAAALRHGDRRQADEFEAFWAERGAAA